MCNMRNTNSTCVVCGVWCQERSIANEDDSRIAGEKMPSPAGRKEKNVVSAEKRNHFATTTGVSACLSLFSFFTFF